MYGGGGCLAVVVLDLTRLRFSHIGQLVPQPWPCCKWLQGERPEEKMIPFFL